MSSNPESWHTDNMLIAMAGLQATGKTYVAEKLSARMNAALVSVDAIENALASAGIWRNQATSRAAYASAVAIARANLANGLDVVVDAADYEMETRELWVDLASDMHVDHMFLVTTCSDKDVHQRRIAAHQSHPDGTPLTWDDVFDRNMHTAFWGSEPRLAIDTSTSVDVDHVLQLVRAFTQESGAASTPLRLNRSSHGARRAQNA